jgi:hypothetical protein
VSLQSFPDYKTSGKRIFKMKVYSGSIEQSGSKFAHVDFANAIIGGGVIGNVYLYTKLIKGMCPRGD